MSEARRPLNFKETEQALAALVGSRVSVRIVERTQPENLLVVFEGVVGKPSAEKAPSRFWPLESGSGERGLVAERPGIVLHEELFGGAEARAGDTVLVFTQGDVFVNIRRL
jgi:hypothetical protein